MGNTNNRTRSATGRPNRAAAPDPLRGLLWITILMILFTVGRLVDVVPILSLLPLVKLLTLVGVIAVLSQRKHLPTLAGLDGSILNWVIAFALVATITAPFSFWPGATRDFMLKQLPVLVLLTFLILKLFAEWRALRSLYFSLAVSGILLATLGLFAFRGGRLAVRSSYDTNELAYVLVGAIPVVLGFAMIQETRVRRLAYLAGVVCMMLAIVLTGSRGGLVALAAVGAIVVLNPGRLQPPTGRKERTGRKKGSGAVGRIVVSMLLLAVVGAVTWPRLPEETRERLATMLNLKSDYNFSNKPEDLGRMQIWTRGLKAFAQRPVGYGVNSYAMVDERFGGRFYTAHNSFILVIVELGVAGIIIYLLILLRVWRGLSAAWRSLNQLPEASFEQRQQAVFCRMIQAGLMGNVVAGLFLSAAYTYAHWVNIALAIAILAHVNNNISKSGVERGRGLRR